MGFDWDLGTWGLGFLVAVFLLAANASSATIHKTDDSIVTGDLQAIADGNLTISATPKPLVIPLDQIMQIAMKGTAPAPVKVAAPAPTPTPPVADSASDTGILGGLFGSKHSSTQKPTTAAVAHRDAPATPTTKPVVKPTTQLANAPLVHLKLTDGDVLHAKLLSWADQKLSLKLTAGPSLDLLSTSLTEIWFGTQEFEAKARALTVEAGPDDVAYVAKDSDVVAVKGLVLGIDSEGLSFRYDQKDRKIGLNKLVGLLLRSNSPAPLAGFHQVVHIESGDQFSGTLSAIDNGALVLATPDSPIKIQLSSISTIDFVNGRVASLCDLAPAKVEQTPYFGHVMPYKIDKSLTDGPLVLSDGPVSRGIAVHSRCVLDYDVADGFERFKTRLGFQIPEGQTGRVVARVLGDGKVLYENLDARGDQPPIDIDVQVTGVKTLTLLIDFGKDQDVGDRVIWANPRLLRGK